MTKHTNWKENYKFNTNNNCLNEDRRFYDFVNLH